MAQNKKKLQEKQEIDKQVLEALQLEKMVDDRFHASSEGALLAEEAIDKICQNGGLHLYDSYLKTKDMAHCSQRLVQFFEEGIQFSFFPGDPGEEEFGETWSPDPEPATAEVDHWTTQIVKTKLIVKVENQSDEVSSTSRSKKAPSIASSRKTFKVRKLQHKKDSESATRSKMGDSMREKTDRKENINVSLYQTMNKSMIQFTNLIPLEVEPPREISEEERLLRDRKEKQLKVKELEMKEQREKEERERMRMKNKQDAFAEIEKGEYTYDHNGKIMIVKKPNLQRISQTQDLNMEFQLNQTQQQASQKVPVKTRLQSAKPQQQKELKVIKESRKEESILYEKAEQELEGKYQQLFQQQNESLKDYGIQKEPFEVNAGIVMTDKEGRRLKGPPIDRERKMTLQEYQKVAAQFDVMSEERMSRYGSAKKIQEHVVSQLDFISENEELLATRDKKRSPERIVKMHGADEIYEKEVNFTQHKFNAKAKRKDLKSANVKTLNEKVLEHHNKEARLTSAKQQQDVRVRPSSKFSLKERIYNYENGGTDFQSDMQPSSTTIGGRPQSGHPSILMQKKNLLNNATSDQKLKNASSLINEFNKKLVEKGTSYPVLPSELPQVSKYLQKKQERPQTGKPQQKISIHDVGLKQSLHMVDQGAFLATKLQKKAPRERIISAKLPKEHDKLPPPPFGQTMGHGFLKNALK